MTGFIDINYANICLVQQLLRVNELVTRSIANENTYFTSRQQLLEFIQKKMKEQKSRKQQNHTNLNPGQPVFSSTELSEYRIPSDGLPMLFFLEDYYRDSINGGVIVKVVF